MMLIVSVDSLNWFLITRYAYSSNKKMRGQQKDVGGDKSGKGLRQFSMKCFISLLFHQLCSICIALRRWLGNL